MKPSCTQTNNQAFEAYQDRHKAGILGAYRSRTLDKVILGGCTTLFFLAIAQASDSDVTPSQYYFLKRNLEAEYVAARAACTVQIGSARDRCIAAAIVHRKQAQAELKEVGASATIPE